MKADADTSFIISLYVSEEERSAKADQYMARQREALPFTPYHRLEVRNGIRLRVKNAAMTARERAAAFADVEHDLEAQMVLVHQPLDWTGTLKRAEALGLAHTESIGGAAADLFHVAAALELGFKEFLTFDKLQRLLAGAAGLKLGV